MCFSRKYKSELGYKVNRRKIAGLPSNLNHDTAVEIFIDKFAEKFKLEDVKGVIQKITIEWWNDIAPSPSTGVLSTVVSYEGQIYNGLNVSDICKVAWRGKIFRSAFAHEIAHSIGCHLLDDCDADHDNNILWDTVREVNAALKLLDI